MGDNLLFALEFCDSWKTGQTWGKEAEGEKKEKNERVSDSIENLGFKKNMGPMVNSF